MSEQISKWFDGELPEPEREQALRRCLASEEARAAFVAYQTISDVLRHGRPGESARRQAIFAALAAEPTVLAPAAAIRVGEERTADPSKVHWMETRRFRAGFAAAASIATVSAVAWIGFADRTPRPSEMASVRAPAVRGAITATAASMPMPAHVQDYIAVHRQVVNPDAMVPVRAHVGVR